MTFNLHLPELRPGERRRLLRLASIYLTIGLVGGAVIGALETRPQISISHVNVENPTTLRAGGEIVLTQTTHLPADCIPRIERWFEMGDFGQKHPDIQLLPDEAIPDYGPQHIPIPFSSKTGVGRYRSRFTTQGCGFLSGFFRPESVDSKPVDVDVLPAQVALTKVAK